MLETPHVAVGAAIAAKVVNPFLAIPLAFGSHFLLDRIPHWNPHLNTEIKKYGKVTKKSTQIVMFDVILAFMVGVFFASRALPDTGRATVILLGAFAAVLPDVIEAPYFFLRMKSKFIASWLRFQKSIQVDTDPIPGLATQLATLFAVFWWILK